MPPETSLPVLGACMPVSFLPKYREWLVADQRDLEIQDFVDAALLNGDWKARVAQANELLSDHTGRLGIHGPFWGFTIGTRDMDVQAVIARRMDQALDVADALGADQIVIHSPFTTWGYNNLPKEPNGIGDVIACAHACLDAAVKRAEGLGVTFVLENIEDKNPDDRLMLARSFDSAAVKLSIDTGHAYYAQGSTGAPPVDYFVTAAGDMLEHVHIQDADGYADRHWAPGMGTMNWPPIFAALAQLSSKPRLNLELRDKDSIFAGAKHLEALGLAR